MNYELAKQLKQAGFPDKYTKDCHCLPILSLSNLIEACGDGLWTIKRVKYRGENGWAVGQDDHFDPSNVNKWKLFIFDPSLEEAVAKLWLALHPIQ